MADISTLVQDIYKCVDEGFDFTEEEAQAFGLKLARHITYRLNEDKGKPSLRMSNLGTPDCKLWYQVNAPEVCEPLTPDTKVKFLFGDILEELLLFLAAKAGHEVEGEQETLEFEEVKGHRDAIIDGMQVDVKSASSFSFKKFNEGLREEDDGFGYLDQQNLYLEAAQDDDKLKIKDKFAFLVIDKTLGKICLDIHDKSDVDYKEKVEHKKSVLNNNNPPPRAFDDVPDGKSGNRKLGIQCSYCPAKETCWPNLRVFNYSGGPRYLTHVAREPKVVEADSEF